MGETRESWDLKLSSEKVDERLSAINNDGGFVPTKEQFDNGILDKNEDVAAYFVGHADNQLSKEDVQSLMVRDSFSIMAALIGRKDFLPTAIEAKAIASAWPNFKHELEVKVRQSAFEPSSRYASLISKQEMGYSKNKNTR